jgi:hypothetical protein
MAILLSEWRISCQPLSTWLSAHASVVCGLVSISQYRLSHTPVGVCLRLRVVRSPRAHEGDVWKEISLKVAVEAACPAMSPAVSDELLSPSTARGSEAARQTLHHSVPARSTQTLSARSGGDDDGRTTRRDGRRRRRRASLMATVGSLLTARRTHHGPPLRACTLFTLLVASRSRKYRAWLWRVRQRRANKRQPPL